jgi:hypothetical protein
MSEYWWRVAEPGERTPRRRQGPGSGR